MVNIPTLYYYYIPLSLKVYDRANETQGFVNFSRLDSVVLSLELVDELVKELIEVFCYAQNLNILAIKDGLGALMYVA